MKRFIAVGLIGLFSLCMVGVVYSSFDSKQSVKTELSSYHVDHTAILDADRFELKTYFSKTVELSYNVNNVVAHVEPVTARANGPPTIRKL